MEKSKKERRRTYTCSRHSNSSTRCKTCSEAANWRRGSKAKRKEHKYKQSPRKNFSRRSMETEARAHYYF